MALPTTLTLEIVTPDRALAREEVDEVVVPGSEGELGILPGHTPLLATLKVGELWYRQGRETHHLSVAFGFVEVLPDRVTILAHVAERAQDIDIERAERARRRAEERLEKPSAQTDLDFERARIAMMKALIRLQVASRARTRV
ncbi:MAG: F0F1 ATP synthase subunit epsilon [Vicinamibacterales bacterium]